jgi:hypothetical protein
MKIHPELGASSGALKSGVMIEARSMATFQQVRERARPKRASR